MIIIIVIYLQLTAESIVPADILYPLRVMPPAGASLPNGVAGPYILSVSWIT